MVELAEVFGQVFFHVMHAIDTIAWLHVDANSVGIPLTPIHPPIEHLGANDQRPPWARLDVAILEFFKRGSQVWQLVPPS